MEKDDILSRWSEYIGELYWKDQLRSREMYTLVLLIIAKRLTL